MVEAVGCGVGEVGDRRAGHPPGEPAADDLDPERIPAAVATLADFAVDVTVDRVHLLRQDSGRVWRPIADARFATPAVSGRGGLPVSVEVTERLPPDARALLAALPTDLDYLAFGHVHRAQAPARVAAAGRYAGSPLALDFSEDFVNTAHKSCTGAQLTRCSASDG